MSEVSRKLLLHADGSVHFYCPGCQGPHGLKVGSGPGPRWGYNGNPDRPTFTPSVLVTTGHRIAGQPQPPDCAYCRDADERDAKTYCAVCHSFITDGRIQFLGDCTHELAGQTVDLPDYPRRWR